MSAFIFGLRTMAGPVAGALKMKWRKFLIYNLLGAATWVTLVAMTGYLFADRFQSLTGYIEKASWGIIEVVFLVGTFYGEKGTGNFGNIRSYRHKSIALPHSKEKS